MRKIPSIWVTLVILYLFICGIRIWYSLAFAGPMNLGDATLYDSIARSIVSGTFIASGAYGALVPPGYPLLLSISYLFGPDKIIIYHAQLILNTLVVGLVLFPAYWFLRDWCTKEVAVIGAVLVATLPSLSRTTGLIMSENLFIPLSIFAFYFIYKAFKTDNPYIGLIAGLFSFSIFFTRSTGIAIFIALVCGFMWYCYQKQKSGIPVIETIRKKWGILAGAFIPLVIWEGLLIKTGHAAVGYGQDVMIASYVGNMGTNFIEYFKISFLQLDYVLLASYIIGTVIALYTIFLILQRTEEITSVLKKNRNNKGKYEEKTFALNGITGFAVPFLAISALAPLPLITSEVPYMYGRYYDPVIPILFLFTILGIQYFVAKRTIPQRAIYGLFLTNIIVAILITLTLSWNSHFDILQNATLSYLLNIPSPLESVLIILLFGIIIPIILFVGLKNKNVMRSFFLLLILMNIIISIPMIQNEVTFSHNFDGVGSVGKYIHSNIEEEAVIFFDNSSTDPFWGSVYYALIDYWITNDLNSVNLKDITLSEDFTPLQGGDYIITALPGSTEPIYTSKVGLSLYHL